MSLEQVSAYGPVDGLGERHPDGSYAALVLIDKSGKRWVYKISEGAAHQLADELRAIPFTKERPAGATG